MSSRAYVFLKRRARAVSREKRAALSADVADSAVHDIGRAGPTVKQFRQMSCVQFGEVYVTPIAASDHVSRARRVSVARVSWTRRAPSGVGAQSRLRDGPGYRARTAAAGQG